MDITDLIFDQLILPAAATIAFNGKYPQGNGHKGNNDELIFAVEFLTSQLVYISNHIQLLGYR